MTNVSKVDALMQSIMATATDMTTQKNTDNSFQAAFDKASISAGVDVAKELDTTTAKIQSPQKQGDTATDHYKKNDSVADKAKVKTDDVNKTSKDIDDKAKAATETTETANADTESAVDNKAEQINDAAKEAIDDIKEAVAKELGISIEDLDKLLESMEIMSSDLLNVNVLPSIVMEANGETDSVALVTNEELMNTVDALKTEVSQILEGLEATTGETTENIADLMKEMTAVNSEESAEIVENIDFADTMVNQTAGSLDSSDIVDSNDSVNPAEVQVSDVRTTETNNNVDNYVTEKTAISETLGQGEKLEKTTESEPDVSDRVVEAQKKQGDVAAVSDDKSAADKKNGFGSDTKEKSQPETNFSTNIESKIEQILNEQQVEAKAEAQHVNTQDIIDQISEHMKLNVRNNMTEIDMQLNPESLGTLHIKVASKEGVVTAQFTTQSEEVKAVIQSQIAELTQKLENENIKIQAVEVTVQSHAFEENLNRGNEQNKGEEEAQKRKPVRRLEIRPGMTLEEIAELDEADQLTAEMMALEGNSVDYTA